MGDEVGLQGSPWGAPAPPDRNLTVNLRPRRGYPPRLPTASRYLCTQADARATVAKLEGLRALGVRLTLDDFGTEPTSLTPLRRQPVRTLKLDHSLLAPDEADSVVMARALASLAHALGMEVAAEGIETDEQLARAREAECDRGQGYLLSRPLTNEAMAQLLQQDCQLLA